MRILLVNINDANRINITNMTINNNNHNINNNNNNAGVLREKREQQLLQQGPHVVAEAVPGHAGPVVLD